MIFGNNISEKINSPIFVTGSSGASDISKVIESKFIHIITDIKEYWEKHENFQQYCNEISQYSEPNWDGYGAKAISLDSFIEAMDFYYYLPYNLPKPDLLPLPSGEVAFEWYQNNQYLFSITFTGNHVLVYAGIYGPLETKHGTIFFNDMIPSDIMDYIKKIYR